MADHARGRRRKRLALGTSVLAWIAAMPSAALAQCAPDPTVANATTTCAGTDADGIRVTTAGTTLNVAAGATVAATTTPAITVDVPQTSYYYYYDTINVSGTVTATGQNGIAVMSGAVQPNSYYSSSQQITLTIAAGGGVSGTTAIALLATDGNTDGTVTANLDNSGTLTGTGGTALLANATIARYGYTSPLTIFSTVTNRAGASIVGGILGPVYTLTNAGSIDGGAGSAVDGGTVSPYLNLTNGATGTIRSTSTAATIIGGPAFAQTVVNGGTIANGGSGVALAGNVLNLTNQAGGLIAAQANAAVTATTTLTLLNQGTITGDVRGGGGGNKVDSTAGTISGSVTLGDGDDTLVARYVGSRTLATGVSGTIDGGGGANTERVIFATDASVTTPIDAATGFQQLILSPASNVTVTLQPGYTTSSALLLGGSGNIVNRATLSFAGPVVDNGFARDYTLDGGGSFVNEGSITASTAQNYQSAIDLSGKSFSNSGSLDVTGNAVSSSSLGISNSGTITASGAGVLGFMPRRDRSASRTA